MSWFRRQSKKEESPSTNRVDELANRFQQEDRIEQLESELGRFDLATLSTAERESWYHIRGIASFQRGDRVQAFARFQEAYVACPESGMIAFSLAQEHEYRREIEPMFELFDKFRFPAVPGRYALAQARYAYLWNRPDKGLQYTLPILDSCYQFKIADDHFLYVRGLPFFGQTWACLGAFYELMNDLAEFKQVTEEASKKLSEYDFGDHLLFIRGLEVGDFSDYLAKCEEPPAHPEFPNGVRAMTAAVLRSQMTSDVQKAEQILEAVQLTERDFRWLDDIRWLARCILARRAGDAAKEAKLRKEFVQQQPLLFEPEHAFNFRLLEYQESLKQEYQTRLRDGSNQS